MAHLVQLCFECFLCAVFLSIFGMPEYMNYNSPFMETFGTACIKPPPLTLLLELGLNIMDIYD